MAVKPETRRPASARRKPAAGPTMAGYLAALPAGHRAALQKLRKQIRATAPAATEGISYGIPTFDLNGHLVAFAAFKQHLSFFPMSSRLLAAFQKDAAPFIAGAGTLRFTPNAPLPAALVRRIVKARMAENAAKQKAGRKR